jgi:hypothetical protein
MCVGRRSRWNKTTSTEIPNACAFTTSQRALMVPRLRRAHNYTWNWIFLQLVIARPFIRPINAGYYYYYYYYYYYSVLAMLLRDDKTPSLRITFYVQILCRRVRKIAKNDLASSCLSVCPSVRPSVYPHGTTRSHCTDFHEIWHLRILRKSVEKIKVWLKPDKNDGTLHEDLHVFMKISRWILCRIRNLSDKCKRKHRHTFYVQ